MLNKLKAAAIKVNKQNGYTLLECLIALSLSTLVLSMAFSIYILGYRFFNLAGDEVEIDQSLRMASERITRCVRLLDNPQKDVYISGKYLYAGNRVYYLQGSNLLERIDDGTNQLALNISRFQPQIKDNMLIINIAGAIKGNESESELTIKLYLEERSER